MLTRPLDPKVTKEVLLFMNDQKTNSQNKLAKECIFTSLMILMEKKDFDSISITEIAKKAGVSRMAYYRNYSSKEDIITDYFDSKFNAYLSKVKNLQELNFYQFTFKFFSFFRKHDILIKNILKANLKEILLDKFNQYFELILNNVIKPNNDNSNIDKYKIRYMAGGLFEVIISWVNDGIIESDEDITEIVCKLTKHKFE